MANGNEGTPTPNQTPDNELDQELGNIFDDNGQAGTNPTTGLQRQFQTSFNIEDLQPGDYVNGLDPEVWKAYPQLYGGQWRLDMFGEWEEISKPSGVAGMTDRQRDLAGEATDYGEIAKLDLKDKAEWESQGYTPVFNAETRQWEPVEARMPASWQQAAVQALLQGDKGKAQQIWSFFNQMTPNDQVELSLRLATSPGDYMTYLSLLRGTQANRPYEFGVRQIPLPEFLTNTIAQSLGLDTGTAPGTGGSDPPTIGGFTPSASTNTTGSTTGSTAGVTGGQQYEMDQYTPADSRRWMGHPLPGSALATDSTTGIIGDPRQSVQEEAYKELLRLQMGGTATADSTDVVPNMGATGVPNMGATGVPAMHPVGFSSEDELAAQNRLLKARTDTSQGWGGFAEGRSELPYIPHGGGGTYKDRFGTTYGLEPVAGGAAATRPVVNRPPANPYEGLLPFESPNWRRSVGYNPVFSSIPEHVSEYATNTPDNGVKGYGKGGIVGLHGPEVALLGEYGPEYVVPMFKGQPLGLKTLGPSYDATGPIPRTPAFGYAAQVSKPRIISTLGAPTIPSAQGWGRMGPVERSQFQKSVEFGGFAWPEYMNQMQRLMPKFPTRGRKPTMIPRFV